MNKSIQGGGSIIQIGTPFSIKARTQEKQREDLNFTKQIENEDQDKLLVRDKLILNQNSSTLIQRSYNDNQEKIEAAAQNMSIISHKISIDETIKSDDQKTDSTRQLIDMYPKSPDE